MHIQRLVLNDNEVALRLGATILVMCGCEPDPRNMSSAALESLFEALQEGGAGVSTLKVSVAQWANAEDVAVHEGSNVWDALARLLPVPSFPVAVIYGEHPEHGSRPVTQAFSSLAEATAFSDGVDEGVGWMDAEFVDDPYAVVMQNDGESVTVSPADYDSRFSEQDVIAIYGRVPVVPGVRIGGGDAGDNQYVDMAMDVGEHGQMASRTFSTTLRYEVERVVEQTDAAAEGCVEWIEGQGDSQVFRLRWRTSLARDAETVEKIFGMVAAGLNAMVATADAEASAPKARPSGPGL